jgi:hypothetical protein
MVLGGKYLLKNHQKSKTAFSEMLGFTYWGLLFYNIQLLHPSVTHALCNIAIFGFQQRQTI